MDIYDLSQLGYREIEKAGELLKAYAERRPDGWNDNDVKLAYNSASGEVFLTNEDYQTLVLEDGRAVMWYFLNYHGNEGTIDDLIIDYDNGNIGAEDFEQLADLCDANKMGYKAAEIRERIAKEEGRINEAEL
jgi:hypothetical protein